MGQIPDGALEKKTVNLGDIQKTLSFIFSERQQDIPSL